MEKSEKSGEKNTSNAGFFAIVEKTKKKNKGGNRGKALSPEKLGDKRKISIKTRKHRAPPHAVYAMREKKVRENVREIWLGYFKTASRLRFFHLGMQDGLGENHEDCFPYLFTVGCCLFRLGHGLGQLAMGLVPDWRRIIIGVGH